MDDVLRPVFSPWASPSSRGRSASIARCARVPLRTPRAAPPPPDPPPPFLAPRREGARPSLTPPPLTLPSFLDPDDQVNVPANRFTP